MHSSTNGRAEDCFVAFEDGIVRIQVATFGDEQCSPAMGLTTHAQRTGHVAYEAAAPRYDSSVTFAQKPGTVV